MNTHETQKPLIPETGVDEPQEKPTQDPQPKSSIPHGAKYEIEVEGKKGYLKNPDRGTIDMALGLAMPTNGNPQYIRAGEIVLQKCWIGGDDEILKDDDLLVAAALQAFGVIQAKTAILKKI